MARADHTGTRGRWPRGWGRGAAHRHGAGRGIVRGRACARHRECTLDCLRAGESVEVSCIDDETARVHALRFGMGEGSRVACVTCIPAGPVILKSGRQEIAVGRRLAQRIHVVRDEAPSQDAAS